MTRISRLSLLLKQVTRQRLPKIRQTPRVTNALQTRPGMTTEPHNMDVNGIAVEIMRKNIRHLYLRVLPASGRVRVSAPLHLDDDEIRLAVSARRGWIRRKQSQLERLQRHSSGNYVTGETHYFEGRRYRLNVVEQSCPPAVMLPDDNTIQLSVRPGADRAERGKALDHWYRKQLQDRLPALIGKWERNMGVKANEVRIRKMKTRWGTCNRRARRIWLNLELMKKPASCLEYVVVHELVHLIERKHNNRFRTLMDQFLPGWRARKARLDSTIPVLD